MKHISRSRSGVASSCLHHAPFCLAALRPFRRTDVGRRVVPRIVLAVDRLVKTEDGQDLLEYGMIVVLIALAAVVAVERVGNTINAVLWQAIAASNY